LFNSSLNSKKIIFNLIENNTTKHIYNTYSEFNIAPLEFKIISLEESIDVNDYTNTFDSGMAIYDMMFYNLSDPDSTVKLDTCHLSIPSIDDYLSNSINFFNKSVKLLTYDSDTQNGAIDVGNQSKAFQKTESSSGIKIITNDSTYKTIITNDGLNDIDYNYQISRRYVVTVPYNKLSDINDMLSSFPETIFIKIPIKDIKNNKLYDVIISTVNGYK
jgi:hypothetical protein